MQFLKSSTIVTFLLAAASLATCQNLAIDGEEFELQKIISIEKGGQEGAAEQISGVIVEFGRFAGKVDMQCMRSWKSTEGSAPPSDRVMCKQNSSVGLPMVMQIINYRALDDFEIQMSVKGIENEKYTIRATGHLSLINVGSKNDVRVYKSTGTSLPAVVKHDPTYEWASEKNDESIQRTIDQMMAMDDDSE